jgi:tRNA modification GTPase
VFSDDINNLVEEITQLRILVESTLDFPEEEIEFLENAQARDRLAAVKAKLQALRDGAKQGKILRDGIQLVLAGAPNVGKSSLLNRLAGEEVAIVTPIAGTTRDRIREEISLEGIPLQIVDTAGLRKSDDAVEKIGIERSWSAIKEADIVLFLRDASAANQEESEILFKEIHASLVQFQNQSAHVIEVWNKQDQMTHPGPQDRLYISAKSGFGIEALKKGILQILGWESHAEDLILARQRHIDALNKALKHLMNSQVYLSQGNASLELFAEELRLAQDELGEITGKLLPDDLLGKIFSSFCIGK